jgi:transcriptional regulator with XRE-family HTH domain
MREALAARDMGAVITIFRRWTGASQTEVGVLLGMSQPHVSDFERGIRHATSLAMFERFADGLSIPRPLLGLSAPQSDDPEPEQGAEQERPARQPPTIRSVEFMEWIAEHSEASFHEVYDRLAARIRQFQRMPEPERRHRAYLRARVTREQLATAWARTTRRRWRRAVRPTTCRWTVSRWLRPCSRGRNGCEHRSGWAPRLSGSSTSRRRLRRFPSNICSDGLAAAVDRLADAELSDTVLTNDPVYRLLRVAVDHEHLDAAVTLMPFVDYALTMDLLESELVDALAGACQPF